MSYRYGQSKATITPPKAKVVAPPVVVVGPSIDEATLTFVRTIMESKVQPHPSQELALNAFSTAFQRWNPQTMYDIKPTDQATLDLLFTNPLPPISTTSSKKSAMGTSKTTGSSNTTTTTTTTAPQYDQVFQTTMQRHRQTIGNLVDRFLTSLRSGKLTMEELRGVYSALDSSTWDNYKAYCKYTNRAERTYLPGLGLGTKVSMTHEINKLKDLKRTIHQYTSVCIEGTTYSLGDYYFRRLGCNGNQTATLIRLDVTEKFCTSALQQQLTSIQGTVGTNPDFLYWYAYFEHHPSILLPSDEETLPDVGVPGQLFDLDVSCKRIRDAFGPNMTYEGVGTALQLLSKEEDYDAEIKLLMNCKILKISVLDITTFRAVKLLHEIATPLKVFIQSCVRHQFKVVKHASFTELQTIVNEFYSAESRDRLRCLNVLHQLYGILCTAATIDDTDAAMVECPLPTLLDRISHLKRALPDHVWMPLQYIFHGSELRKYFRNMQWLITDEENDHDKGLRNFHGDHKTLVAILTSHDATDELLMIVEPLIPVVELFFYLECHCNCLTVHELVTNLMNDEDIQTLLQDTTTIQDDIHALSGRIHSLQDLFQNICHLPAPPIDTTSTSGKKRKNAPVKKITKKYKS